MHLFNPLGSVRPGGYRVLRLAEPRSGARLHRQQNLPSRGKAALGGGILRSRWNRPNYIGAKHFSRFGRSLERIPRPLRIVSGNGIPFAESLRNERSTENTAG